MARTARVMETAPLNRDDVESLANATGCTHDQAHALLVLAGGSLRELSTYDLGRYTDVEGIGIVRAQKVRHALDLGRAFAHEVPPSRQAMRGPRDVSAFYAPRLQDALAEEFHVCILDAQHRMKRDVLVTRGILNSSLVHPREVFREAIAESAAAIIVVHNHPSGDPTPSAEDRTVTEQLVSAGRLLDIPVHDHIVIGRGRYVSFAEAGLM